MIAYIDSSLLARAYFPDNDGHREALDLIGDPGVSWVTGTWTRIEVSGAMTRAASDKGRNAAIAHEVLDRDLDPNVGSIREVRAPQRDIERLALSISRRHVIRAMDAWHLACASLVLPRLAEAREAYGFATRDAQQAAVAEQLGLTLV